MDGSTQPPSPGIGQRKTNFSVFGLAETRLVQKHSENPAKVSLDTSSLIHSTHAFAYSPPNKKAEAKSSPSDISGNNDASIRLTLVSTDAKPERLHNRRRSSLFGVNLDLTKQLEVSVLGSTFKSSVSDTDTAEMSPSRGHPSPRRYSAVQGDVSQDVAVVLEKTSKAAAVVLQQPDGEPRRDVISVPVTAAQPSHKAQVSSDSSRNQILSSSTKSDSSHYRDAQDRLVSAGSSPILSAIARTPGLIPRINPPATDPATAPPLSVPHSSPSSVYEETSKHEQTTTLPRPLTPEPLGDPLRQQAARDFPHAAQDNWVGSPASRGRDSTSIESSRPRSLSPSNIISAITNSPAFFSFLHLDRHTGPPSQATNPADVVHGNLQAVSTNSNPGASSQGSDTTGTTTHAALDLGKTNRDLAVTGDKPGLDTDHDHTDHSIMEGRSHVEIDTDPDHHTEGLFNWARQLGAWVTTAATDGKKLDVSTKELNVIAPSSF